MELDAEGPAQHLVVPPQFGVVAGGGGRMFGCAAKQSLLGGVRLEAVRQLVRAAQRRGVPAVDLVRGDAQALLGDSAEETSGEQAVIATD